MPISFNEPELEGRLQRLGQMQPVPVSKHAMLREIVREATRDLRRPNAWRRPNGSRKKGAA